MKNKIYDCVTFFRENYMTNLRFDLLNDTVDFFVVCESKYDHKNNYKGFNFILKKKKIKNKLIYIKILKDFPTTDSPWERQAYQRDYMLNVIKNIANPNDYILFSDPDEIPNPKIIKNIKLKKKFGIFFQKTYVYNFLTYAKQYSPWEGTRIAKLKNLESIDYLRQKILSKNLKKWWRPDKEKSIEIFENGGWHFNNFLSPKELSLKLKTFAHTEFAHNSFSDPKIIRSKINRGEDLYGRNHFFIRKNIDQEFKELVKKKNVKLLFKK